MASGRHGDYRDAKITDHKAEYAAVKKNIVNAGGDEDWSSNADHEKHRKRIYDSLEYQSRVRERKLNESQVVNGSEYHSGSGRSDSGAFDDSEGRNGLALQMMDREPGELSSDDDPEIQGNGDLVAKKLEDGKKSSPVTKKRKFSPIVWDRDDKVVKKAVKRLNKVETEKLAPSPSLVESYNRSHSPLVRPDGKQISLPIEDCEVNLSEKSPIDQVVGLNPSESHAEPSFPQLAEKRDVDRTGAVVADDDEYLPERTIVSSRWANDSYSPLDEGEISDYEGVRKSKGISNSESAEDGDQRKLISPELVEIWREGSEGLGGRSSESDGRVRSSTKRSPYNGDSNSEKMEIDGKDDYAYGSISGSDSESKDDGSSHGTPVLSEPVPRSVNMLKGCRSVDEFERLNKIDEGTYGVVFRARHKKTGEIVALKKVKMEKEREGSPLTSLREINILLSFHHPSIVDVKEVVVGSNLYSIFMVMEYMEHDLKGLMETMKQPFSQSEVKCLMLQLLEGVKYLHDNWVLHRDLKTSNILLNNRGELKICDFGMARQYGSPLKPYTHIVVTLWYRAPELLLGAKEYSTAIDMWSLGCIMAELLSKEPLFCGKKEFDQLDKIFRILGTPNEKIWPGYSKLPGVKVNYVKHPYNLLRRKFPATSFTGSPVLSDAGFDLLNRLLTYDPEKRISAEAALNHEWFREVPLPKSKEFMPTFPAQHDQDRRTRRLMKSPDPLEVQRRKELQQGELGTGGLFGQ